MSNHKYCTQCRSQNIYVSPNGYDTVIVCKDCHHEEHAPHEDKKTGLKVEVENLSDWPENCNSMHQDLYHMGLPFAKNYIILHAHHATEEMRSFIFVNEKTGHRVQITISDQEEEDIAFNPEEESYSHYLERIGDQTQDSGDCQSKAGVLFRFFQNESSF